jgi:transposase
MSTKRKCVVIKIELKLEAVRRIKNGEILRNVAADFCVGISTVSDWVKSKSKLKEHSSQMAKGGTLKPKNVVKKKFKLKYQIFFIEICSVVLYL